MQSRPASLTSMLAGGCGWGPKVDPRAMAQNGNAENLTKAPEPWVLKLVTQTLFVDEMLICTQIPHKEFYLFFGFNQMKIIDTPVSYNICQSLSCS